MYICDVIDMSPYMVDVIHAQLVVGESGRTGRQSELSKLDRYVYIYYSFRDSISARYKSRVGRIR